MRFTATLALAGLSLVCSANSTGPLTDPNIFVPTSSIEDSLAPGRFVHTNHLIYVGPPIERDPSPDNPVYMALHGPLAMLASSGPAGYHPADIRRAYNLPSTGGSGAIAIVDAYHYPTAKADFNTFSAMFGLPKESSAYARTNTNKVFQLVFATGSQPQVSASWSQEAALDIEWAHAMAPSAKIYLVEAKSSSYADMFAAVQKAATLPGVRQISMSWGGSEFSGEVAYDAYMAATGIVYFASSGDNGGVKSYPAISPNVVGVGGTCLKLDNSGNYISETAWSGSGGGLSTYEPFPTFQSMVQSIVGSKRGSPDISFVADPYTGCAVYDSTPYSGYSGWMVFGGTSLAAPCVAGITNLSGTFRSCSAAQNTRFYNGLGGIGFRDIVSGKAGTFSAKTGWDYPTGLGSPIGLSAY